MTKGLSKSRYTAFCQCPKNLWLHVNKPNEAFIDDALKARFAQGNEVGDLAMGLFGPSFVDVTTYKPGKNGEPELDLATMVVKTKQEMVKGTDVICEASFALECHYCAVDILRRNGDGWDIYEVKSSTYKGEKEDTPKHLLVYTRDIAYQKWLLEQCGIKVCGTYLVRLNKFYVRGSELDIQQLFHVKNMDALVADEFPKVQPNVTQALKVLEGGEPDVKVAIHCHDPYDCAFFDYCTGRLAKPNVFNLYRMDFERKCKLFNEGKIYYEDVRDEKLSEIQKLQINNDQQVSAEDIRTFLPRLTFPLYFLDFETMMPPVPQFQGTRPFQQIPFQYSLHWIEEEGGELHHTPFLGNGKDDPRRALAEQLCNDIPRDVCVTAYNMSFERGRIKELAESFPDLREHLMAIHANFVDLIEPFRKKMVYLPDMDGSFSIKQVLPALCPSDPELNYANLPGCVHNGGDAMTVYPKLKNMSGEEYDATCKALRDYCYLDTLAMVKIWENLKDMAR